MQYLKWSGLGDNYIIRSDISVSWFPLDASNADYQQFLQYLTDNNLTIDDIPWFIM